MMLKNKWHFSLALMGLLLMGAFLFYFFFSSSFPIEPTQVCTFEKSQHLNYDIKAEMDFTLTLNEALPNSNKIHTTLTGNLNILSLKQNENKTELVAQLKHTKYQINNNNDDQKAKQLSIPFYFHLTNTCTVSDFQFTNKISKQDAMILKNIVQEMQLSFPQTASKNTWQTNETNTIGAYHASYHLLKTDDDSITLQKNKEHYTRIHHQVPQAKMTSTIKGSHFELKLSKNSPWLESIEGSEDLQIFANDTPIMEATTYFEAYATKPQKDKQALFQDEKPTDLLSFEDMPFGVQETKLKSSYPVEQVINRSLDSILSEFQADLDSKDSTDKNQALNMMTQYLNHVKNSANNLIQAIKTGTLPEKYHSKAFLALELCGNKEAQTVLLSTINDDSFSKMNRVRAMIAIQDIPNPTAETVTVLVNNLQTMKDGSDSVNYDVASTAALSLGTLASKNTATHPEYLEQAKDTLLTSLKADPDPNNTSIYLKALGNTKDASVTNTIGTYLDDNSETVRSAAASALGSIRTPETETVLQSNFIIETSTDVRHAIMRSLNKYKTPTQQTISVISDNIQSEKNDSVRAQMITFLGKRAETNQTAHDALVQLNKSETNNRNIKLIGKYIN